MDPLPESPSGPFRDVWRLYVMHCFFAFVSRMWELGIVLLVAKLTNNSLFVVALCGLCSSSSIFFFSSSAGTWFDKSNRLHSIKVSLIVKFIAITCGYVICAVCLWNNALSGEFTINPAVYALPVFAAVANFSFAMITMAVEKDWVVVLAAQDSEWLSRTNSNMTQIDLACNALAPVVTGVLFSLFVYRYVAIVLLLLNALSVLLLYFFLQQLYNSFPHLSVRKPPKQSTQTTSVSFLSTPCAAVMIAYATLYFTVLSFSSLMIVYLRWGGMPDSWIGTLRGAAALSGFLGAYIYPTVRGWIGLINAGTLAIWYQFGLVAIAALSIIFLLPSEAAYVMSIAVICSRVGLWMFDLVARQIAQEGIEEVYRGAINGKWRSLIAFFDLSTFVVAILFPNPEQFWILTSVSCLMVLSAAVTYTVSVFRSNVIRGTYQPVPDMEK